MSLKVLFLWVFSPEVNTFHQSGETVTCNGPGEYYAHEYECDKYYFCDAGSVPILNTCGAGTHFDIGSSGCVHISSVTCTPSSPTTSEHQLQFTFVKVGKFTTGTKSLFRG